MGKITGNYLLSSMAHSLSFSARSQSHAYTSSSDSHNLALNKFEAGLAERLCSLRAGSASANLNWLIDALAVANSTQSSLRSIIPQLKSHNKIKLQQSLDSTAVLLDVCNALKDAMAEIQDYLTRLQKAVKPLSEEATSYHLSKRLQTCLVRMEAGTMKRWQSRVEDACRFLKLFKRRMRKSMAYSSTVEGATLTTALILALMTTSFAEAVPDKNSRCDISVAKFITTRVNAPTWAGPLRDLQRQLAHGDVAIFQELKSLHVAARILIQCSSNTHENCRGVTRAAAAGALLKKARDTEASVAELRQKLASLFQSVASVHVDSLAD